MPYYAWAWDYDKKDQRYLVFRGWKATEEQMRNEMEYKLGLSREKYHIAELATRDVAKAKSELKDRIMLEEGNLDIALQRFYHNRRPGRVHLTFDGEFIDPDESD